MTSPQASPQGPSDIRFPATRWTLIREVQQGDAVDARRAMEDICRSYWYPIYAFARSSGFAVEDAEDVTQQFFQDIITHESLLRAREDDGRLRTFMLAMLKRIISKHLRHESAAKRGGRNTNLSFDDASAEPRFLRDLAHQTEPDKLFDRTWAEGLLNSATQKLRHECAQADDLERFDLLAEYLPLGDNATPYAEVASRMNIEQGTLRLQIHRMRKRYAKLIEEEIAETVENEADQKAELAHLLAVMGH